MGSFATGAFGTVPGLLLLPYLTDTVGVSAGIAALVVFLPKAWDVILHPITGRWSDAVAVRTGTRRPFLLWGGILLAIFFGLLFIHPFDSPAAGVWWAAAMYFGCATAISWFQVPYVAMPAEMTDLYHERTRLMTLRVAFLAIAILVSGAGSPAIRNAVGGADGYRLMGIFVAVLILVGGLAAWAGTRSVRPSTVLFSHGSIWQQLRSVIKVRDFVILALVFAIQYMAIGMMLAGVDYVATYYLHSKLGATIIFVCFVAPALLTMRVWQRMGEKRGKKSGYVIASSVLTAGVIGNALVMFLLPASTGAIPMYLMTAIVGVGYAGSQVFPLAMLPDTAAYDARRTGSNRIGLFTGVWTAVDTVTFAAGTGAFALALAFGGYLPGAGLTADGPQQPAMTWIVVAFTLVPAVLFVISLIMLRGYRLTGADVEAQLAAENPPVERTTHRDPML